MRLSTEQIQTLDAKTTSRALESGLEAFERDTSTSDPELSQNIAQYRGTGNWGMYARIVEMTDQGVYQRGVLALCLQSGIDMTTAPEFGYIIKHPALSGNTKARHLILMAMAFQRTLEGTT